MNLVVFALEKIVSRILEKEIQLHETHSDVVERMPAAVANVVLGNGSIDKAGEEMKDRPGAHVIADRGVSVLQEFLSEGHRALSPAYTCIGKEVAHREVAGVRRDHIEKPCLGLG